MRIALERNTSRNLGIAGAKTPKTMQASVFPEAQIRKGKTP